MDAIVLFRLIFEDEIIEQLISSQWKAHGKIWLVG